LHTIINVIYYRSLIFLLCRQLYNFKFNIIFFLCVSPIDWCWKFDLQIDKHVCVQFCTNLICMTIIWKCSWIIVCKIELKLVPTFWLWFMNLNPTYQSNIQFRPNKIICQSICFFHQYIYICHSIGTKDKSVL